MVMRPDLAEWHRRSKALRRIPVATQTTPKQVEHIRKWAIGRRKAAVLALRKAQKAQDQGRRREAAGHRRGAHGMDAFASGLECALLFLFCKGSFPRVEEDMLPPEHSRDKL